MNEKRTVSLVILDLDNTLWDWVDIWGKSFKAMLDRIAADSGIPIEQLKSEFKAIHQRHGTSEYAYSLEELPSLQAKHPNEDVRDIYSAAVDAYRAQRTALLRTYPKVVETLEKLKDAGCLLVAYTESMAYYTSYRLTELGLDRIIDYLYSPPDHDLPKDLTPAKLARALRQQRPLRRTIHRHTPRGEVKPNPRILADIITELGADKAATIYVGDNLMKDVAMAQAAGVTDVWAKYGGAQGTPEYNLLREVTHWTAEMVQREKDVIAGLGKDKVEPSHVLESSFDQLLSMFTFAAFKKDEGGNTKQLELAIDVWKKIVDVQQHFNTIEMTIRNFAITAFVAVLGGVALAVKERIVLNLGPVHVPVGSLIALAGMIAWSMFYMMDQYWYHKFLKGAGEQAGFIEDRWAHVLPEMGLSTRIKKVSTFPFPQARKWLPAGKYSPFGRERSSTARLRFFYWLGIGLLGFVAVLALFAGAGGPPQVPPPQPINVNVTVPPVQIIPQPVVTPPEPVATPAPPSKSEPAPVKK